MGGADKPALILVVDDDPDTLTILCTHLEREGFRTLAASSGAQCLELVRDHAVEVILLDLMMPAMDGFGVCRALKADAATADIPIVVLSARDDYASRAEAMRLGVAEYLVKPATRRHLVSRVRAQLDASAAGRAADELRGRLEAANRK